MEAAFIGNGNRRFKSSNTDATGTTNTSAVHRHGNEDGNGGRCGMVLAKSHRVISLRLAMCRQSNIGIQFNFPVWLFYSPFSASILHPFLFSFCSFAARLFSAISSFYFRIVFKCNANRNSHSAMLRSRRFSFRNAKCRILIHISFHFIVIIWPFRRKICRCTNHHRARHL